MGGHEVKVDSRVLPLLSVKSSNKFDYDVYC